MSEISLLSAAMELNQSRMQTEIGMVAMKQAAQAEKALADMLASNAKAIQRMEAEPSAFSVYV